MVSDFFVGLYDRYSRDTLAVTFPDLFQNMLATADDAKWEILCSNNIQPCRIFYNNNIVTKSEGVIFVTDYLVNKEGIGDLTGEARKEKLIDLVAASLKE